MTDPIREWKASSLGIAGALAAGAFAARQANAELQYARHEARIDGRARVVVAKASRNAALRRKLAVLNALASK